MRLPNSLQEITIDKYLKAIDIINNEDIDLSVMLQVLNLFTDKTFENLLDYPITELEKNYQKIVSVLNEKSTFQKTFLCLIQ